MTYHGARVCHYVRCGTTEGGTCECIGGQILRGWSWCAKKKLKLLDIVIEDRVGPEGFNRPCFNTMLMRAQRDPRPFDIILVDTPSRFARCASKLRYSAALLARAQVRLATIQRSYSGSPEGEFWK